MANKCIKCGKSNGFLSPDPLELGNGDMLCFDCSEIIRNDITKLYGSKSMKEFDEIKESIIAKSKDSYNEKILLQICILIDNISKTLSLPEEIEIKPNSNENTSGNSGIFSNIGHKIKQVASISAWIGITVSVIVGLIMLGFSGILGLTIMLVGTLIFWLSSFPLYGFGQLIDNTDKIVELLKTSKND